MMQTQRTLENQQSLTQSGQISGSLSFNGTLTKEDEEMSKSALSTFKAKEEEIEKKKMEVKEKVQAQLGRIEEETKRLATIREVSLSLSLHNKVCEFFALKRFWFEFGFFLPLCGWEYVHPYPFFWGLCCYNSRVLFKFSNNFVFPLIFMDLRILFNFFFGF